MTTIEVYEAALCCATGVCGPDVPQALVDFGADLEWVQRQGGQIRRFNLASEPAVFAANEAVVAFLRVSGSGGLPLVLVDGVPALTGRYPGRDELAGWAGLADGTPKRRVLTLVQVDDAACCGGSAGSC